MKIIKLLAKWVLLPLLLLVIVAGVHTWYFKPWTIDLFLAREAAKFAFSSPELLSSIRILEPMGITYHNDDLDDSSIASGDALFQQFNDAYSTLITYSDDSLSESEQLSKQIMLALLEIVKDGEKFRFHNYPLNQMFGVQNNFPSFMDSTHQVHSKGEARDYISRLSKVGVQFQQIMEGLEHREANDILPPKFVIRRVLDEMNDFVATQATENILYTSFTKKLDETDLTDADKDELSQRVASEIESSVYPAYQIFIDYFTTLESKATTDDGVWKLPDGDEYYRLALKFFTTTNYSPEEIHNTGIAEVARIQREILAILEQEGWDASIGFVEIMNALKDKERFYYPDTDEGRSKILEDYKAIIADVNSGLSEAFDIRPKAKVDVLRIPAFKEKTAPGAYYQGPPMDGSQPGKFFANLYDIKATPKYGMRTLAYHEAIPGHHFQIAIQRELEDIPFFRKFVPFTAYSEGWALYAERLAWELGFEDDPYDNIGRLQAELFRGVRLVVDTGIHYKRWTREEAIKYMLDNTGIAESDAVSEIERYIVLPGQACAYKVGMMKILELREKAKSALGDQFDLKEFHNAILTNGSVPLFILEELIDQYIENKQHS